MSDARARIEELRTRIADCELLGSLANDPAVREENRRLAEEYRRLLEEAETHDRTQAA